MAPGVRMQGHEFRFPYFGGTEMRDSDTTQTLVAVIVTVCVAGGWADNRSFAAEDTHPITFQRGTTTVTIEADGDPLATYVFQDPQIPRPYFTNLCAPGGVPVTRHHPPRDGLDPIDHERLHPGLWLAFGDLTGVDFWRNKARVEHIGFVQQPGPERAGETGFAVHNRYCDGDKTICREYCEYTFLVRPSGYLILWNSMFYSGFSAFHFGDQEEMGLGVRMATPIMVMSHEGGRILDSEGRRNEKEVWGKQAQWCDYSGQTQGVFAGITIMPAPDNVRPCRWHARDYGLMVANPFGLKAFGAGEASKLSFQAHESFQLSFGVLIHAGDAEDSVDLEAAYQDYANLSK